MTKLAHKPDPQDFERVYREYGHPDPKDTAAVERHYRLAQTAKILRTYGLDSALPNLEGVAQGKAR